MWRLQEVAGQAWGEEKSGGVGHKTERGQGHKMASVGDRRSTAHQETSSVSQLGHTQEHPQDGGDAEGLIQGL